MREEQLEGVGGLKIFVRSWSPETRAARAVVVLTHGFNSHSGYYQGAAEQLVERGFAVHALDLRGRGRSDGERFYVQKFADYVDDVARVITQARSRNPGLPLFLLGHSAGGVVACLYALEHQSQLAGLISESFAHEVPAPDFALAVLKGLSHVAPHAHVVKLKNEDFSRDPKVVEQMNQDPLIAHEAQSTQTMAELVRADQRLKKEFSRIQVPLLILHGTADRATKPAGSQHFYELAGSGDKTLKLYEGHYHDLLNDLDKEVVLKDILAWLDARV
jgi:acylglycerol lipase